MRLAFVRRGIKFLEVFQNAFQSKPETCMLGDTEVRKVGSEIWFMNQSQIAWAHVGILVRSRDKTIRALRENGFRITDDELDSFIRVNLRLPSKTSQARLGGM